MKRWHLPGRTKGRGGKAALAVTLAVATGIISGCGHPSALRTAHAEAARGPWPHPPALLLQAHRRYQAVVRTTAGSFTIRLFAAQDPPAVASFVFLARHHFYDGLTFFRILPDFLVQTGSPADNGRGGPGYTVVSRLPPPYPYQTGIVALAAMNRQRASGSQFFVCAGTACQTLNRTPIYPELGRVTQGMAVITRIAGGAVKANPALGGEKSLPLNPVRIESITVTDTASPAAGGA